MGHDHYIFMLMILSVLMQCPHGSFLDFFEHLTAKFFIGAAEKISIFFIYFRDEHPL